MAPVDTEGDDDTVGDIPAEDRECSSGSLHNPIPGQASVPESKINIRESPYFSYNYFERQANEQARCLLCSKLVSRKQGNTAGMKSHLYSNHKEEYAQFVIKQKRITELRNEVTNERKNLKSDSFVQTKLFGGEGNKLSLEKIIDPLKQKRFDEACVMFCAETNCSFQAMKNIDNILSSL